MIKTELIDFGIIEAGDMGEVKVDITKTVISLGQFINISFSIECF